ncbi:MAG TPA: hypothetical protein VG826_02285 [Pirellulales bacterium]|nr:hypothetical protein [Pirellulales bacterium]
MLALLVSVATAQDQPRLRGLDGSAGRAFAGLVGMGGSPTLLLSMPEVRKELSVSDEQGKEIDDVLAALRESRGGFSFQEFQNLSNDERQNRMQEMRAKAEEAEKAAAERLNKILKPEQLTRLNQSVLQRQGTTALTRPEITNRLGLSQEQQDKIQEIQEDVRPRLGVGGLQNLSDEERQSRFAEMRERRNKAQADMLAVLTNDQMTKWTELRGEEFDFPAFSGFGGTGRPASEGGPTEGGPTEGGPTEGGPSEGGPSEGGPSEGGPSEGGPSEGGPSEGGPSEGGPGGSENATTRRGQKLHLQPDANATHVIHSIYFGTDGLPTTPYDGIGVWRFVSLGAAWVVAVIVGASALHTDFLGHSYFGDNPELVDDLRQMIENDVPAAKRKQMHEMSIGEDKWWEYRSK